MRVKLVTYGVEVDLLMRICVNTNSARENMLKQQIRAEDVLDDAVLRLVETTPREAFVPHEYRRLAFTEASIPLGHEQHMLTPMLEAKIIQTLQIHSSDKVLEIGTGSGYMTALLAKSAQHVYSIDIFPEFLEQTKPKLDGLDISNVTLQAGNAAMGWDKQQPYDVICITGSLPILPKTFQQELKIGGRLFAVVGTEHMMEAVLVTRLTEKKWQQQRLFETEIAPLLEGPTVEPFSF